MGKGITMAELLTMPVMVNMETAARALGLSRSTGYELARRGEFPCRGAACRQFLPRSDG